MLTLPGDPPEHLITTSLLILELLNLSGNFTFVCIQHTVVMLPSTQAIPRKTGQAFPRSDHMHPDVLCVVLC